MDIYDVLRQDHEKVRDLLDKIEEEGHGSGFKAKEKDFERLLKELMPHEKAEEAVFYPKLMDDDHREDALEAVEEHHAVDLLIQDIRQVDPGDEHWSAKMSVIKEMIEHHIEEEEGQIFDDAGDVLSKEEASSLAEQFQSKKKELLSSMAGSGMTSSR